jgi:hypothetical protein
MMILRTMIYLFLLGFVSVIHADDDLNLVPITADNADQLQLIGRLGRGVATSLDWHPDGEILAVGSGSGVWLLDETLQTITATPIDTLVSDLAWSPDGSQIAIIKDCVLEIWSADFAENVFSSDDCAHQVSWSADGRYLWALIPDGKSLILDRTTLESQLFDGSIEAWSPDHSRIFTTLWQSDQNLLYTWEFPTGDLISEIEMPSNYYHLLWGVDTETVAMLCYDNQATVDRQINLCHLNTLTGEATTQVIVDWSKTSQLSRFEEVMLHPDGQSFAYKNPSHPAFFSTIWEINLQDGTLGLSAEGTAFDWHPITHQMTSIRGNGQIITDGDNGAESQFFTAPINMIDIRPNQHQIATTGYGYEQDTYVWDIEHSWDDPLLQFYAEPAQIVQYTADGSGLIAGGIIGTDRVINQHIGLYDADTGDLLKMLSSYYGQELPANWIFNADYSEWVWMPELIYEGKRFTYWNNLVWDNYYSDVFVLDQPFIDSGLIEDAFAGDFDPQTDVSTHYFTQDMLYAPREADIEGVSGRLSGDGRLLFRVDNAYGVIYVWGVVR